MKLVIAGNHSQAEHWARELGWKRGEWKYLSSRHQMYGCEPGTQIHLVGLWPSHPSQRFDSSWREEMTQMFKERRLVLVEHDPDTGVIIWALTRGHS